MNAILTEIQVFSTTDYDQFKKLNGNRQID